MRVILNLVPVRAGGGQQQAFQFLQWLKAQSSSERARWFILVGRGSALENALQHSGGISWRSASSGYLSRMLFGLFASNRLVREFRADIVFHYTTVWPRLSVPQVVRSVYSNLYFPEVQFWPKRPLSTYLRRKLIDFFRRRGTFRADGLIFENRSMQQRAISQFGYPERRTQYVAPSRIVEESQEIGLSRELPDGAFRILYLSTWHLNKNIQLLPRVAALLKGKGLRARFVLSLDVNHPEVQRHVVVPASELGVLEMFEFVGAVHPNRVSYFVNSVNCLILLSQLECFSANISEAWSFRKPLIISDLEWARGECKAGALYVDRDSPNAIAEAIFDLANDPGMREKLVAAGTQMASSLNSLDSRFRSQISFLERIRELGKQS